MKKFLRVALIITLNLAMGNGALLLYFRVARPLVFSTEPTDFIEELIALCLCFLGLYVFIYQPKLRPIAIGSTALCIPLVISLVFLINASFTSGGTSLMLAQQELYYNTNEDEGRTTNDYTYYAVVNFHGQRNEREIPLEQYFTVDSVLARTEIGLFGLEVLTNELKIIESKHCNHDDVDLENQLESHRSIAHDLAKRRCLEAALYHYTQCLKIDSNNAELYNTRGYVYMVLQDYDYAVLDFYKATIKAYSELSLNDITRVKSLEEVDDIVRIILNEAEKSQNEQSKSSLLSAVEGLMLYAKVTELSSYYDHLKYCNEKLNDAKTPTSADQVAN